MPITGRRLSLVMNAECRMLSSESDSRDVMQAKILGRTIVFNSPYMRVSLESMFGAQYQAIISNNIKCSVERLNADRYKYLLSN